MTHKEPLLKHPAVFPKERIATDEVSPSRKNATLEKTSRFGSSLVLCVSREEEEYKYLETLQQRHLQEKELADRLMRQALSF